jgi:hypothetical protein
LRGIERGHLGQRRKENDRRNGGMEARQNRELEEIIKSYGISAQVDMCIEECSELQKALLKYRRNDPQDGTVNMELRSGIIDEIADVAIMLQQMNIIFGCAGEVGERIDYKIDRQMKRLKGERV